MGTLSEISMSDVGKSELSNAFKEIKPERNLSKGEAVTLVKTKFETQDENSLSDMIHNYDETDFDLHFEFDKKKEKNINLPNEIMLKIINLTKAERYNKQTDNGDILFEKVGSPYYIAPEVLHKNYIILVLFFRNLS